MMMSRSDLWVEIITDEGVARREAHKNHASSRPLSKDYELIGLAGETAFGRFANKMPDLERKLGGDKGVDFIIPLKFSVDVKTARKATHLLHEEGKNFADIYVLAEYDSETKQARLIGWEWGKILKKAPVKDFGYGVVNHYIEAANLKPISELKERLIDGI
jgi:hypothetical protein